MNDNTAPLCLLALPGYWQEITRLLWASGYVSGLPPDDGRPLHERITFADDVIVTTGGSTATQRPGQHADPARWLPPEQRWRR